MGLKIAAICTAYHPLSHADVIVTRWLDPHPRDAAAGFIPRSEIAALYVAQRPAGHADAAFALPPRERRVAYDPGFDISGLVASRYGVPVFGSVREALTLGGDRLAVDAVLLIGEHGNYPRNDFGQQLYPRKELFDQVTAVFRQSGRVVPLFLDKHLSWNMAWAREMADTVKAMGIPFLAGSSAALAGPAADLGLPAGSHIDHSLGLFDVHPETYGFHSLELVQSIVERRAGGESGIGSIRAHPGEEVWAALERGAWPRELFEATLAAAAARPGDVRENCRRAAQPPAAFLLEHLGGHRSTHLLLDGHVEDFAVGIRRAGDGRISAASVAGSEDWRDTFLGNFAILDREIQGLFLTGRSPMPIERTLLTTLAVATFMHALARPGETIPTPWLHIAYGS